MCSAEVLQVTAWLKQMPRPGRAPQAYHCEGSKFYNICLCIIHYVKVIGAWFYITFSVEDHSVVEMESLSTVTGSGVHK